MILIAINIFFYYRVVKSLQLTWWTFSVNNPEPAQSPPRRLNVWLESYTKSLTQSKCSWSRVPVKRSWFSGPDSLTPEGSAATSARSRLKCWMSISIPTWLIRILVRRQKKSWQESVESQCPRYTYFMFYILLILLLKLK